MVAWEELFDQVTSGSLYTDLSFYLLSTSREFETFVNFIKLFRPDLLILKTTIIIQFQMFLFVRTEWNQEGRVFSMMLEVLLSL